MYCLTYAACTFARTKDSNELLRRRCGFLTSCKCPMEAYSPPSTPAHECLLIILRGYWQLFKEAFSAPYSNSVNILSMNNMLILKKKPKTTLAIYEGVLRYHWACNTDYQKGYSNYDNFFTDQVHTVFQTFLRAWYLNFQFMC